MQKIHCPFSYNVSYQTFPLHFGQRFILFFDLYETLCVFYEKISRFASLVRPSKIWYNLIGVYTKRFFKYSKKLYLVYWFQTGISDWFGVSKNVRTFQKIVTLQKILFFLIEIFAQKFGLCKINIFENLIFRYVLDQCFPKWPNKFLGQNCFGVKKWHLLSYLSNKNMMMENNVDSMFGCKIE